MQDISYYTTAELLCELKTRYPSMVFVGSPLNDAEAFFDFEAGDRVVNLGMLILTTKRIEREMLDIHLDNSG